MITFTIDIIILLTVILTLRNVKIGFLLSFAYRIIFPSYISLVFGPISISVHYITTAALALVLILKYNDKGRLPDEIKRFVSVYAISTFIMIFMSSGFVPISYQIQSFIKGLLFLMLLYIVEAEYASRLIPAKTFIRFIGWLSVIIGMYGIVSYYFSVNPYIAIMSLNYGKEDMFSFFLEEERGGLTGRAYGTTGHPLSWGQYWDILLAFLIVVRDKVNKYFFILLFVIGIANIVLCGSRTAIVTLIVMLMFTCMAFGIRKIIFIAIFTYLACILLISALPKSYADNGVIKYIESAVFFWDSTKSDEAKIQGSSKDMRFIQLEESMEIANNNPIGGIGYQAEYYAIQIKRQIGRNLYGFESFVFKILVEQGYIGLIVFIFLFNSLRKYALKVHCSARDKILVNGYCFSFLTSIVFTGIQGQSYIFFIIFLFFIIHINATKKLVSL